MSGCVAPRRIDTQTEGRIALRNPGAEGRIERDRYGVPHLIARSENDVYFLQGFAQAQDRLWVMELFRRSASGRLSEIVGNQRMTHADEMPFVESTIDFDHFHRLVGFRQLAEQTANWLRRARPESYRLLQRFSAGVNAYIAHARRHDEMPWEFRFFRFEPAPWTPADTLTIYRMLAWHFSHDWSRELLRLRLLMERPTDPGAAWQVFPFQDPTETTILDSGQATRRSADSPTPSAISKYLRDVLEITPEPVRVTDADRFSIPTDSTSAYPEGWTPVHKSTAAQRNRRSLDLGWELKYFPGRASNAFAVSGRLTQSGKPLLAGDPHSALVLPSIFADVWLTCDEFDAVGVSLVGLPGLLMGTTFAWRGRSPILTWTPRISCSSESRLDRSTRKGWKSSLPSCQRFPSGAPSSAPRTVVPSSTPTFRRAFGYRATGYLFAGSDSIATTKPLSSTRS
jgi:penicillin amidase